MGLRGGKEDAVTPTTILVEAVGEASLQMEAMGVTTASLTTLEEAAVEASSGKGAPLGPGLEVQAVEGFYLKGVQVITPASLHLLLGMLLVVIVVYQGTSVMTVYFMGVKGYA